MSAPMYVRLKPLNARRGIHTRTYNFRGAIFHVERGWYKVSAELAELIRPIKADPYPDAMHVFDVCTEDEAASIHDRETAEEQVKRGIVDANVVQAETFFDEKTAAGAVTTESLPPSQRSNRQNKNKAKTVVDTADL